MATHMPMAATRQPFAPLNSSRLQNLTSLKNRQNALSSTLSSPTKRKATAFEDDDSENIDPSIFLSSKRSRAPDGSGKDTITKPTNFFLTKAPPSSNDFTSLKAAQAPSARRPILTARSPAAPRLNTSISKSTPLSAPAGRSPTRKRIGILNRRRTSAPFTRVDPPKFCTPSTSSGLGFSIDAALSGTIPSYGARPRAAPSSAASKESSILPVSLHQPEAKESWFFDIHEDTAEELATNLMEHSTCTLDISSDEESAARLRDERGKENVPPPDDISQTRTPLATAVDSSESSMSDLKARVRARRSRHDVVEEGAIELDRNPLGDLVAEDFYADGCDGSSVILVPSEEEAKEQAEVPMAFDFSADVKGKGREIDSEAVDVLMQKDDFDIAPKAALLEPIEKPEDNFEVWESGSAKDETEC
ncbi:Uncharacterized protein BP5553_00875 [Venustampulla echinocandica]|uniref:Thymidylate kinase n=1 Tax=Venustampulla echinocandica TaxID=2656787 RepID=A0A370TZD4_9HELO|nr:Uncharacterized protein BP5553_00875 [Venustampulla echinocandica]RDL40896.1 Uncharacterized protein BP5553_00875 [Venustampulla echinocandica]